MEAGFQPRLDHYQRRAIGDAHILARWKSRVRARSIPRGNAHHVSPMSGRRWFMSNTSEWIRGIPSRIDVVRGIFDAVAEVPGSRFAGESCQRLVPHKAN